jgi:tetratricopeptide (TPR) repeat protein
MTEVPARRRVFFGLVALALLLRLAHFFAVRHNPLVAYPILDSQEYDRWARAIVAGQAPAEAFFQPPLYAYLIATIYALGGAAPGAVYVFQIVLALLGCWAIYRAGSLVAGEPVGFAAATLFAVYPQFIVHDVLLLKESLAVTTVAFLLWALAAARAEATPRSWAIAGLLCGTLSLLRENALLMLPLLAGLAWWPAAPRPRRALRILALFGAAALPLLPVAWRNASAGGGFVPTSFQGGVNFYIGNHAGADGTYQPLVPGKQIPALERSESVRLAEQATGRQLRASEVSSYWLGRALTWARQEPLAFARLQLHKLRLFWSWYEWPDAVDSYYLRAASPVLRFPWPDFGGVTLLALAGLWMERRRLSRLAVPLVWIVGSMLATTAFFLFSRYRLPTVPGLMILAGFPLAGFYAAMRERRRDRAVALGAILAAALVLPRLPGYGPRWDLVHFNLGRVHQETGDAVAAAREYELALAANPDDFLSCLNLGTLAARQRRYEEARGWFERAARLAPDSDDAEANLGGALLALGRLEESRAHLKRALELNPTNAFAIHNLGALEKRE